MKVQRPVSAGDQAILSSRQLHQLIASDAIARRVLDKGIAPKPSDCVGVRLNLNLLKRAGLAIQTVHKASTRWSPAAHGEAIRNAPGFFRGEVIDYQQLVHLENAYFCVDQKGRERIARGDSEKFPMASVDGLFVGAGRAALPKEGTWGVPIRFNPKLMHLFCDPENRAVRWAERVIVFGNRAFASGRISFHTPETAPERMGAAPSCALLIEPAGLQRKPATDKRPRRRAAESLDPQHPAHRFSGAEPAGKDAPEMCSVT